MPDFLSQDVLHHLQSDGSGHHFGETREPDAIRVFHPALAFYKLQSNAYKFSWALIPISVPFVWLLFLHRSRYRRFGAYDHVVFVTYSITFMSLALIVSVLFAQTALSPLLGWLVIPLAPLHMYRQLRGAYELSRWSAVWRTVVLLMLSFLAITLFMLLLAALGIAG